MSRSVGKKIALGFAVFSVIGAVVSLGVLFYALQRYGVADPISASMIAFIVFFVSCATVLWVMSRPPRYPLEPWDEPPSGNGQRTGD